jgi:hypothetical protein
MRTYPEITVGNLKPGELYITGPGDHLFVKVDGKTSRDVIKDHEFQHVDCRLCTRPAPKDFRTAARRLSEARIFAVRPEMIGA